MNRKSKFNFNIKNQMHVVQLGFQISSHVKLEVLNTVFLSTLSVIIRLFNKPKCQVLSSKLVEKFRF